MGHKMIMLIQLRMEYPDEVRDRMMVVRNMLTILHNHRSNNLANIRQQVSISMTPNP
jgi:hypothetical protein